MKESADHSAKLRGSIMNWEAIGALSEFVGAVAVVITLVYLAIQIRQNTRAIRLDTGHDITEEYRDIFALMAENKELAELVHRAAHDPDSISGTDKVQYYALNSNFIRALENAYFQHNENALDRKQWSGMRRMLKDYAQLPAFREYWPNRKHWFSNEFQEFMESDILTAENPHDVPLPGQYE